MLKPLESGFAKTNPGLYTTLLQSSTPFAGASKDPDWLKFVAKTQNVIADYRNSIYGASLTNNELKSANLSLPDISRDSFSNIVTKLDALQEYAQTNRNSLIQDATGQFTDNPAKYKNTEYSDLLMKASPEQLKALGM